MTTYNTGNPLGSAAAKDLYDNSQNFDHLSNDRVNETWTDRFGVQRLTWHGMEKRYADALVGLGLTPVGTFQDGATLESAGDIIQDETTGIWYRWDDLASLPKTVPPGSTPESTGGIGDGAWLAVDVSDVLRRDLASSDPAKGSSLVTYQPPFAGAPAMPLDEKLSQTFNAMDWLVPNDGTDGTEQLDSFVAYINSIPNPDGARVGVYFPSGKYVFSNTMWFTRPVHVYGKGADLHYMGVTGDAIKMGPDGLKRDFLPQNPGSLYYHRMYSISDVVFRGGTTSGYAVNFNHWIVDCRVQNVGFRAFGGDGSWGVNAEFDNWTLLVENCDFDAHIPEPVAGTGDELITRNFVRAPGFFMVDGVGAVADMWGTRANIINNRVYSSSRVRGGVAYLLSGWKSRVIGGSSEGMLCDVMLATNSNDIEINGLYTEKNFNGLGSEVMRVVQLGYDGDAYHETVYQDVNGDGNYVAQTPRLFNKRLRILNYYGNFGNNNGLVNKFVSNWFTDTAIEAITLRDITCVHFYGPLVEYNNVPENRNWFIENINYDGDIANLGYVIEPQIATPYKPSYVNRVHNGIIVGDATMIVNGFSGAAPMNNVGFGVTGLALQGDGSGGAFQVTKRATWNDLAHNYERNKLEMQANVFQIYCSTPATGQTYLRLAFDTDLSPSKIQDSYVYFSFYGIAGGSNAVAGVSLRYGTGDTFTGARDITVRTDTWRRYVIPIRVLDNTLGSTTLSTDTVRLLFKVPVGSVFQIEMAAPVLNIGSVGYPLRACF